MIAAAPSLPNGYPHREPDSAHISAMLLLRIKLNGTLSPFENF